MMRIEHLETTAALLASEVLAELLDAPLWFGFTFFDMGDVHHTPTQVKRLFDGLRHPRTLRFRRVALRLADDDAINHHFDGMLPPMVDTRRLLDVVRLPIDAKPHIA